MRTDEDGEILWTRLYGDHGRNVFIKVLELENDGLILAGKSTSIGAGEFDFWMMATDVNGEPLWSHSFGGNRDDQLYGLLQTVDGGFLLSGESNSFGVGENDFWMVKTDENGDSLWSTFYGGERDDKCRSIAQTDEDGFVIFGSTTSFGEGDFDFYLVKTGPDPVAVGHDPVISYPVSFSLLEPFPNPFNSSVSIGFRTPSPGIYALDLIDPSGRQLGIISEGYFPAGESRQVWNGQIRKSVLPAGNYFVRLTNANGSQDIKPIVLVK